MRFKKETDAGVVSNSTEKTGCINHGTLNEILSTLCPNHRKLLTTMLKCLIQEKGTSNVQYRDQRIAEFKNSSSEFNENKSSEGLCNCNRFRWCENCTLRTVQQVPFPWVSCCLKNLHCLSCKKDTHGYLTIISNGVCKQCNRSNIYQICTGSYKQLSGCTYAEGTTIQACSEPPDGETFNIETIESSTLPSNVTDYSKPRSPSPPPLSPVRTDEFEIDEMSKTASALDANSIELTITHPPSLSPEEENDCDSAISSQTPAKLKFAETIEERKDEFVAVSEISRSPDSENDLEKGGSSASFQEVMERINEKLKTIETTDDGQILANLFNNDSYQGSNGSFKLREIATTLLHKAKVSDYSLMELLRQHEENRIIQTRFRKRQETLIALHNSPDSALSRRQTVQIKRDLANFDQLFSSKKSPEKFGKRLARSSIRDANSLAREYSSISEDSQNANNINKHPSSLPDQYKTEVKNLSENSVLDESRDVVECLNSSESSDLDLLNILEVTEMDVETPRDSTDNSMVGPGCTDVPLVLQNSEKIDCRSNIGRAKRNILPPERFSIYITEPRKMFYAACFSENPQRKPIKTKKPDLDCASNPCKMSNADSPMTQELLNGQGNIIVYEVTESLEVSTSSQPELLKGINNISNENHGNEPNLPEVVHHASQQPNELVDQCNNEKQKTTTVLNADPVEAVCSTECNGPAQSDICINCCTKDNSKFVDKHGILENAVNNLLSSSPESGATNILESKSLGSDYLSVISPLQQKDSAEEFGKPDHLQHATCECSVLENTGSVNKTGHICPSSYSSPIKLMFLSKISSEKGIKYTLTSVDSSKLDTTSCISNLDLENVFLKAPEESNLSAAESSNTAEYFQNPCPRNDNTVECFPNSTAESGNAAECLQSCSESSSACEEVNCNLEIDTCSCNSSAFYSNSYTRNAEVEITDQVIEMSVTSKEMDESILKRKPGRPKKLGPPVEKQIKRPKGRPPKPKVELSEPVECTAEAPDSEKDSTVHLSSTGDNRNIRITVVYGRSRRFKRFVSENDKIVVNATESDLKQTYEKQIEEMVQDPAEGFDDKPHSSASSLIQGENQFDLVRPIKDKTVSLHTSGNAICPNSKLTTVKTFNSGQRKPGRPAKVKISGISVTVDAVSPQERKVSINSVLPPLVQESSPSNKLFVDASTKDGESSARIQNDCETSSKESLGDKKAKSVLPLRQSVRLRKPSLHFLHSFASSSSFSQSSALVHKSRRLLLNKAGNELAKIRNLNVTMVSENATSNVTLGNNKEETTHEVAEFGCSSELSADPIFIPNNSLKWWHTSTSKQTLQEELDMQFEQVNRGWLPVDPAELNASDKRKYPIQLGRTTKSVVIVGDNKHVQVSPIQMLFQENCNMDKICTWFMQTTETHSLSIVRKENARDPIEVLNAQGILTARSQVDTCPSPQAEHFKKHLKKFALESPVRLRTHFTLSSRMSNLKVCKARRKLLRFCKPQHSSHTELSHHHRVQYEQWKCVNGNPRYQNLKPNSTKTVSNNSKKTELEINSFPPEGEPVLLSSGKENESKDKLKPRNSIDVGLSDCATIQNINSTNYSKCKRTEKFESIAKHSEQESFLEGKQKNTCQNVNWKLGNFKECRVFLRKINSLEHSHLRNYNVWQQSKNRSSDTKGTSNLQRYTEEKNDSCSQLNVHEVNAFETQSLNSTCPNLCELKGKRKHKERTSNENGLDSSPSKKVQHFSSKWSKPCQVDSDHFPSLSSNSNLVNESNSQKENADIMKSNAGKRKRCQGVSTTAVTVKRLRRSSVKQRLPYNQLPFQIGNSS